jgi:DNA mismatch repair protein MutS
MARSTCEGARAAPVQKMMDDLPLFAPLLNQPAPPSAVPAPDLLREALAATDPDELTPREALERLYEIKRLARSAG